VQASKIRELEAQIAATDGSAASTSSPLNLPLLAPRSTSEPPHWEDETRLREYGGGSSEAYPTTAEAEADNSMMAMVRSPSFRFGFSLCGF
jgi:hypothetical protein